jgi:hypothetical protein
MVLEVFRTFWPSRSFKKGPDLIDKIDALERQLRSYADDAQAGEETPLFGDIPDQNRSNASKPTRDRTGEDSRNAPDYADVSTEDELSRFEYSCKPIRIAAQMLRDLVLFLEIGIVWLLDRWYRWLFVALPIGLYITAYRFITRELVYIWNSTFCMLLTRSN